MSEDQHRQQDPHEQYSQPQCPEQDQRDQHLGLETEMQPGPDYGEETYRGHGRFKGKVAIITGGQPVSTSAGQHFSLWASPTNSCCVTISLERNGFAHGVCHPKP